ncbi:MAG: leucine-rich repeat protein [Oscillospiraceae bacterium]|nr:leucine-rich repeat protein [Oscillospiraceae bacterium]
MKRICLLLAALLLLCGCAGPDANTQIQVSILEGEGFTLEQNGLWAAPGSDVVFRLKLEPGLALAGTDYSGTVQTRVTGDWTELKLCRVRYPSRIRIRLTEDFARITYDPNGGQGELTTIVYDRSLHRRPNTENGQNLFSREGYTLTGWNTCADGSGERIGLGSRVTAGPEGKNLYAQWEKWNPETDFTFTEGYYLTITGYHGNSDPIVIPETIGGRTVGAIAHNAFRDCGASHLILPPSILQVAEGAFQNCAFESVTIFDSIEGISNSSFRNCEKLRTVRINAFEAPYGYRYRKESVYADKVDLLIQAAGAKKLVFYGGCAAWYNLDARQAQEALGDGYRIVNLALNGTVHSGVQLQILEAFLEPGDIFFHTPELSSDTQMMRQIAMGRNDDKLWCGLENNYDLVSLVDLRTVPGMLESFCAYLAGKDKAADYAMTYLDSQGRAYLDSWGGIPFERTQSSDALSDAVYLDPDAVDEGAMERLGDYYRRFDAKGVRVYVGYACVNLDAVPEEQQGNVQLMDTLFRQAVEAMDGPVLISRLEDYLYRNSDFYDTNYHLLSDPAERNTALWLRDLLAQMARDGLEGTA